MTNLNRPDLSPEHPANKIPKEVLRLGENAFAAKLSFKERCQILALRVSNMSIGAIAVTFGVNRRTVTHICNPDSSRYKSVRAAMDKMGETDFVAVHVDSDLLQRVMAASATEEANSTYVDYENSVQKNAANPNPKATSASGVNMHKGPTHAFTHRIEVKWVEWDSDVPSGWYAMLLDVEGVDAGNWLGDPDSNSHMTSKTALAYAKAYLDENY